MGDIKMDLDGKTLQKIQYLLSKSLDNNITPQEAEFLDQLIISNPQARRYYVEFIQAHVHLHRVHDEQRASQYNQDVSMLDMELWEMLSKHEMTAESVEVEREIPDDNEPEVVVPVQVRKTSKLPLLVAVGLAAAMLLFMVYAYFSPGVVREEVAEIADSINAVWSEESLTAAEDVRLLNNSEPLHLLSGFAKIRFDYGAEVVVEGPAKINLNNPGQMLLSYGRISVDVPRQAIGFTVETPYSRIVDIGTEFGVKVDVDGTTDIHMFKGKASLIPGKKGQAGKAQVLTAGKAMCVEASGLLKDIAFETRVFVRKINSKTNLIWRGKKTELTYIDLADIVGGGNGFGTAKDNIGLNPLTGENVTVWPGTSVSEEEQSMAGPFRQAQSNWIDGAFIPDGGEGLVQIASNGLSFDGFGDTCGNMFAYIQHQKKSYELTKDDNPNMADKSCIFMHSNVGITFDLDKIRERFGGQVAIKAFRAGSGFRSALNYSKVDFWVLVDGRVRYKRLGTYTTTKLDEVEISINPDDRYLTVAVTESDDGIDQDWAIFASPMLILE
jgi:hypothetical protein